MSEDYLNTPANATEMVTEISRGDHHPFPIPEKTMGRVQRLTSLIREPWYLQGIPTFHNHYENAPSWVTPWENSIMRLRIVSSTLDSVSSQFDCSEADSIHVASMALEREILRLEAIWEWAREVWEYDPVILALATQPPAGDEEATPSDSTDTPSSEEGHTHVQH